ncbi:MAG: hypothetical protein IKA17_01995 [Clostridia bacterium]|nr:hypothetical protein [Clostridia bacterium]
MADINVLMMGGRRAGKTSVLAAMDQCCNELLATIPNLSVSCKDGGVNLTLKKNELEHYFTQRYMKNMMFTADVNPSVTPDTYTYEVNVNNRDSGYTLNFMDFPGEWLFSADKQDELQKMVDMSQIIIITIDTPHMVESIDEATKVGKYHSEFNRVPEITRFFKNAFQKSKQERMVLFVPLKCEKYYYRNKMNIVSQTLKNGYSELLSFLANDEIKELCTVGIVPILTIGGAEFMKFNDNGYAGIYSYVEDLSLRKYNPKYCEQPLFFTLNYLIKMAERNKLQQGKISRWFKETFTNAAKLADLIDCKETLEKLIETNPEMGFEIIQNPLGIEVK